MPLFRFQRHLELEMGNVASKNDDGDNDGAAITNKPDANTKNAADSSTLTDSVHKVAENFTLFPLLPPELRFMVWEFAMAMEKPRLVHLHARGCGIRKGFRRRGCPRGRGPRLNIYGSQYEQVPPYFFVNNECRFFALKHYSIRFPVTQEFQVDLSVPADRRVTNIIMSPSDILVSWHTEDLLWASSHFHLRFGPQASLVRNMMVNPWRTTYNASTFEMVSKMVAIIGNLTAIEKVYLLSNRGRGPLKYGGGNQYSIDVFSFNMIMPRVFGYEHRQRLETLQKNNNLEWLYVDAETNANNQVSGSKNLDNSQSNV